SGWTPSTHPRPWHPTSAFPDYYGAAKGAPRWPPLRLSSRRPTRGRPPVLLELGDDLVGNEPQGVHHHVPRHRGRPVDLEHDLVAAEVFPEKVNALHHLLRRPKQVGVCSGLWAGRPGVGAADARP